MGEILGFTSRTTRQIRQQDEQGKVQNKLKQTRTKSEIVVVPIQHSETLQHCQEQIPRSYVNFRPSIVERHKNKNILFLYIHLT